MKMIITTLTLTQPWATLCALSTVNQPAKDIETRGWKTWYRGPLAIHAAKAFPRSAQDLCEKEPFKSRLRGLRAKDLPRGSVLCIRSLIDCVPTALIINPDTIALAQGAGKISSMEKAFGDYSDGRYGFFLGPVTEIFEPPIPAVGSLSIWGWRRE